MIMPDRVLPGLYFNEIYSESACQPSTKYVRGYPLYMRMCKKKPNGRLSCSKTKYGQGKGQTEI